MAGKPKVDLVNQRFGNLVALEITEEIKNKCRVWKCKCDCGKIHYADSSSLRNGKIKSCGCSRIKDLTGQRFGRWAVIRISGKRRNNSLLWECHCDCGNVGYITGAHLVRGDSRSCGCLAAELAKEKYSLPDGVAAFNSLYGSYRDGAKKRGYKFNLTKKEFRELTEQDCYYCGTSPSQIHINGKNGGYVYNGVDRLDNNKGYFLSNCVPCCKTCNFAKSEMTQDEFANWIYSVYHNFGLKQHAEN